MSASPSEGDAALINEVLTDDELRAVLARLGPESERDGFGSCAGAGSGSRAPSGAACVRAPVHPCCAA